MTFVIYFQDRCVRTLLIPNQYSAPIPHRDIRQMHQLLANFQFPRHAYMEPLISYLILPESTVTQNCLRIHYVRSVHVQVVMHAGSEIYS